MSGFLLISSYVLLALLGVRVALDAIQFINGITKKMTASPNHLSREYAELVEGKVNLTVSTSAAIQKNLIVSQLFALGFPASIRTLPKGTLHPNTDHEKLSSQHEVLIDKIDREILAGVNYHHPYMRKSCQRTYIYLILTYVFTLVLMTILLSSIAST